jgi:hypothetical protein
MSRSSYSDIRAKSDIVRRAAPTRAGQVRMRHKALAAPDSKYVATMFATNLKRQFPFGAKLAPVEVVQSRDAYLGILIYVVRGIDRSNECF